MRSIALAFTLALGLAGATHAQPAPRCTHDTLAIQGQSVAATYCVTSGGHATAGQELRVAVTETFTSPRGKISQPATLLFIRGEANSRVIEDLSLERLGANGTLHLTLALRDGLVRIESAMLTPGAVTIK